MYTVRLRLHKENNECTELEGAFVIDVVSIYCSSIVQGYLQESGTTKKMLLCGCWSSYFEHLRGKRTIIIAIPLDEKDEPFFCITENQISGKWFNLTDKTQRPAEIWLGETREKGKALQTKRKEIKERYREMFHQLPELYQNIDMAVDYKKGFEKEHI